MAASPTRPHDFPADASTFPAMHDWSPGPHAFELAERPRVVVRGGVPEAREVARLLADDLVRLAPGVTPVEPFDATESARAGDVELVLDPERAPDIPAEGYRLELDEAARVTASDRSGLLYGTQSFLQLLKQDPMRRRVPGGVGMDQPSFPVRGQMIDIGRKFLSLDYLRSEVRRMAWLKLNSLHLHLTEWNGFRFESLECPGLASTEHYTQAELRALDAYADSWGVQIVPEIDLPGHATWLTRYDPRLRIDSPRLDRAGWPGGAGGGWMLDVTSEHAREVVRRLVVELAGLFGGDFVHIGGDELPLQTPGAQDPLLRAYAREKGLTYAADTLVDLINDLAGTLRQLGRRTEIWEWWGHGDQPVSIAPDTDIRVDAWLDREPGIWARAGYETVGVNWGGNYITPGYATTPGATSRQGWGGHMAAERLYETNHYPRAERVMGYRLGRWMDKSEPETTDWVHFFSRRPLLVVAERVWGGPGSPTAPEAYARADAIGSAEDARVGVPVEACRVSASSCETDAEDGSARNVLDPHPQTNWVTAYRPELAITPHALTIDVGEVRAIAGVEVWPRQDGHLIESFHHSRARARRVRVEVGSRQDGEWREVWAGELPDQQNAHRVDFDPVPGRVVRLVVESDWENLFVAAMAYVCVLEAPRS